MKGNKLLSILLYIVFILLWICVIDCFKSGLIHQEGLNNFYESRPNIVNLYMDEDGNEISNLGNYGKCLIINNEIQLCDKEEHKYHECLVHLPIRYLRNNVENVVIVGGGDLMTLREVMKYKTLKKVFMLELSPEIVELCKKHFQQDDFEKDKRVEIIYGDANETIDTLLEDYKYKIDITILDTTEDNDDNLTIDTPDFFFKCFLLLHKNGIFVKNGLYFKNLFESYDDLNVINFNVDIPYFQEKYTFTIAAKPNNDIRKISLEDNRWKYNNIKTKFYKPSNHNNFIIHDEYVTFDPVDNENEKLFFKNSIKKEEELDYQDMEYNDEDMFKKLL